mmetsp:Transcript_124600/g.215333  ORF Transcript_124600/g.215333 Transcript_124600/m.215333 type:complete len:307 (-) Transcript_124600:30-950(-)
MRLGVGAEDLLELVVEDQDDGAAGAADDVGQGALEEGAGALVLEDLAPAVQGVLVQDVGAAGLHHHAAADRVEGVRDDARGRGDRLGDEPRLPHGGVLGVLEEDALGRVEAAEEGRAVHDDAHDGHAEALVQALEAVRLEDLHQAVAQAGELAVGALADIGAQAGTREVKGVHEQQRGGAGGAARGQVAGEEAPEVLAVHALQEHLLVLVLEGEVERLRREVADDVGQVAAPQRHEALLRRDAAEGVHDALVLVGLGDLRRSGLHLQQKLHALDGSDDRLRDAAGHATSGQILQEVHNPRLGRHDD